MSGNKKYQQNTRSRSAKEAEDSDSELSDRYSENTSTLSHTSIHFSEKSFSERSPSSHLDNASPRSTRSSSSGSFTSSPRGTPVRAGHESISSDGDNSAYEKMYPDLHSFKTSPSHTKPSYRTGSPEYKTSKSLRSRDQTRAQQEGDRNDRSQYDKAGLYPSLSDKSPNKKQEDNTFNTQLIFIILSIMALTVMVYFNYPSSKSADKSSMERESYFNVFVKEIEVLESFFPNQKRRFWNTVIASSKHVLNEPNSMYPSVILLASQVKTSRLGVCIAEKIASSFLRSHSIEASLVPSTDIDNLKKYEARDQKLLLDREIQATFETSSGKAYVIKNLQSLLPQAALLLHGLCDGDNAPFKDVMILMTLQVRDDLSTASEVEDYLTQLWTTPHMDYDKVSALMSRISNNLVVLQHEDSDVMQKMCP